MLKTKIGPTDGSGYYVMTRMNEDTIYRGRKVPGKTVTHVFLREGDRCIYTMLDHASCENRAVCAKSSTTLCAKDGKHTTVNIKERGSNYEQKR